MTREDAWIFLKSAEINPFKDELFFRHSYNNVKFNDVIIVLNELFKGVTDFWDCDFPYIRVIVEILDLHWELKGEVCSDRIYTVGFKV